jgi:hypothetical protein
MSLLSGASIDSKSTYGDRVGPQPPRVRPRDSLRSEHLDGNAGAVASRRAPPSVRGERAPRGRREATFGLLPSRSDSWLELDLWRHAGLCAGQSHVHRPFVYRFAPQFAREWREAGGKPLAVLVPSPSSGAEFEGRPGSSPRRFFCFLALGSPRKARAAVAVTQSRGGFVPPRLRLGRWGTCPIEGISAPSRAPSGTCGVMTVRLCIHHSIAILSLLSVAIYRHSNALLSSWRPGSTATATQRSRRASSPRAQFVSGPDQDMVSKLPVKQWPMASGSIPPDPTKGTR